MMASQVIPLAWCVTVVLFSSVTRSHDTHDTKKQPSETIPLGPDERTNRLRDPGVVQDEGHIQEHLNDETNLKVEDMTAEEMEFHYFRLHDTDNNTKLDGLEILAALTHMMPADDLIPKADHKGKSEDDIVMMEEERRKRVLDYYVGIIDQVLEEDDFDHDGYLTYIEYALARRRDERKYRKEQYRQRKHTKHSKV